VYGSHGGVGGHGGGEKRGEWRLEDGDSSGDVDGGVGRVAAVGRWRGAAAVKWWWQRGEGGAWGRVV
nr:hypothetical protein [Tanacetum cinerariifolium]